MNNNGVEIPNFMQNIYKEKEQEKLRSEIQIKEMYIANQKRLEERKKIKIEKRKLFKKNVKRATVASALVVVGGLAFFGHQQFKGSERIANQFFQYTDGYSIVNLSSGYSVMLNGKEISPDSAFYDMVNDARYGGMSDPDIYIGISKLYSSDCAKEYVGKVPLGERIVAKQEAYVLELAEEYGVEINFGKASGGIRK